VDHRELYHKEQNQTEKKQGITAHVSTKHSNRKGTNRYSRTSWYPVAAWQDLIIFDAEMVYHCKGGGHNGNEQNEQQGKFTEEYSMGHMSRHEIQRPVK